MKALGRGVAYLVGLSVIPTLFGGCPQTSQYALPSPIPARIQCIVDDAIFPRMNIGQSVGMVVGVIAEGEQYILGYGKTRLPCGPPPDGTKEFEIGSMTKAFTGILLARMVNDHLLKLSDPVRLYLPQGVKVPSYEGREITLLDLATHTSGLPRIPTDIERISGFDSSNPYAHYTIENMYAFLSGYTLTRKPGTKYEYSNVGFGLLGHVLALKSGVSFEELFASRIGDPADLNDTRVTLSAEQSDRLVQGYSLFLVKAPYWQMPAFEGAGGLHSTAEDMLKFLGACVGQNVDSLREAADLSIFPQFAVDNHDHMGLGWHVIEQSDGEEPLVMKDGGTYGFVSFMGFLRASQIAVVVLGNTAIADVDPVGVAILAKLAGRQLRGWPAGL